MGPLALVRVLLYDPLRNACGRLQKLTPKVSGHFVAKSRAPFVAPSSTMPEMVPLSSMPPAVQRQIKTMMWCQSMPRWDNKRERH